MPYVFYRADERTPNEIRDAGGFKAWTALRKEQACALVKRFTTSTDIIDLPLQASQLRDDINKSDKLSLLDLSTTIKRETNRATLHISTDLTEDVGGRSSNYIYKIEYDSLNKLVYIRAKGMGTLNENPDSLAANVSPVVLIDSNNLDSADTIAVSCTGNEVFFLTEIPYSRIRMYKTANGNAWVNMP